MFVFIQTWIPALSYLSGWETVLIFFHKKPKFWLEPWTFLKISNFSLKKHRPFLISFRKIKENNSLTQFLTYIPELMVKNHDKVIKLICNAHIYGQFDKIQSLVESDKRNFIINGPMTFLFYSVPRSRYKGR